MLVLEATPPGISSGPFPPWCKLKKKGNLTSNFPVRTASLRATIDIHHHPPLLSILGSYHPSMISLLVLVALLAAVTQIFIPKGLSPWYEEPIVAREATACCSRQLLLCPLKKAFLLWVPGPVKSQSPKLWGRKYRFPKWDSRNNGMWGYSDSTPYFSDPYIPPAMDTLLMETSLI